MMKSLLSGSVIALAIFSSVACGPHFTITAPQEFVVLTESVPYDFRATTPDGLVLAVREFDNNKERGDVEFWVKAIENELRLDKGYALLGKTAIKTRSGLSGTQMRFGLDRENEAHEYLVVLFVTGKARGKSRVYVVEVGGTSAQVQQSQKAIAWAIAGFDAR